MDFGKEKVFIRRHLSNVLFTLKQFFVDFNLLLVLENNLKVTVTLVDDGAGFIRASSIYGNTAESKRLVLTWASAVAMETEGSLGESTLGTSGA
ncbi:hypothetical protein FQN54_008143 [Arachnomyces sp. PD_36]|nr:hypothetical protein FQN54_008143 [Arachnomyces sp. PD_36]